MTINKTTITDGHWRHVHGHYSAALLGKPIGGDLWPWLSGK